MSKAYLKSPIGILEIVASENGICEINFVDKFEKVAVKDENLKLCLDELEAYFKGELKKFSVRLDVKTTKFRAKIYDVLQKVPYGETTTYAALALAAGHKNAYRAAGSANAKTHYLSSSLATGCSLVAALVATQAEKVCQLKFGY